MNKGQMNLQDLFLNQVRKDNIAVTIYLVGGVQLKGMVRGFDAFTVILESMGKPPQLVYKHAIASVVPARSVGPLYRDNPEAAEPAEKPQQRAETPQQQAETPQQQEE